MVESVLDRITRMKAEFEAETGRPPVLILLGPKELIQFCQETRDQIRPGGRHSSHDLYIQDTPVSAMSENGIAFHMETIPALIRGFKK